MGSCWLLAAWRVPAAACRENQRTRHCTRDLSTALTQGLPLIPLVQMSIKWFLSRFPKLHSFLESDFSVPLHVSRPHEELRWWGLPSHCSTLKFVSSFLPRTHRIHLWLSETAHSERETHPRKFPECLQRTDICPELHM